MPAWRTGGAIGKRIVPSTSAASGCWAVGEAEAAVRDEIWPQANDRYWGNVSLLLHMDGSGSTFTDSASTPTTITANGSATQSSTQSKFGGKSLALNGSSSYLSFPSSTAFNFGGDFTIEGWVYPTSLVTYIALLDSRTSAAYQNYICGLFRVGDVYRVDFVTDGGANQRLTGTSTVVPLLRWSHVAVVRSGTSLRCYVDGVRDSASVTYSGAINAAGSTMLIGKNVDGNYGVGYIDEVRVTKAARYTSPTFTPSATAFQNS